MSTTMVLSTTMVTKAVDFVDCSRSRRSIAQSWSSSEDSKYLEQVSTVFNNKNIGKKQTKES